MGGIDPEAVDLLAPLAGAPVLSKTDRRTIDFDADVKGGGIAVDIAGELAAIQRKMAQTQHQSGVGPMLASADHTLTLKDAIGGTYSERLLGDAKRKVAEEQYDVALDMLAEFIALEPEHAEARFLAAFCHRSRGEPVEALRALLPLRGVRLDDEMARLVATLRDGIRAEMIPLVVIAFLASTDPAAAEARVREAIEVDPETGLYYVVLSGGLASGGNLDRALSVAEEGLANAVDERERLEQLAGRVRRELLGTRLADAIEAFKDGDYPRARREVASLADEWRSMPVVRDFQDYLDMLIDSGRTAAVLRPEGPFERVDDLYFLLAGKEIAEAKRPLGTGDLPAAEKVLERALTFVPAFPYANFLYALAIYQRAAAWLVSPGGMELDELLRRLKRAGEAAAVAATDREIRDAVPLADALKGLRSLLAQARDALQAQMKEAEVINPAIEEYRSIMESVGGGVQDPEHFDEAIKRLRKLAKSLPKVKAAAVTAPAREAVARLEAAVARNLEQAEQVSGPRECFDEFGKIMGIVKGGLKAEADLLAVHTRMRKLREKVAASRKEAREKEARKALDRLAKTLDSHLKQLGPVAERVRVGKLIQQFNAVMETLNRKRPTTYEDRAPLVLVLGNVSRDAGALRAEVQSKEARKQLADLQAAADKIMTALGGSIFS